MGNAKERYDVYNITEDDQGKSKWVNVGIAFVNRDSSINVVLSTYPTEGSLQLRKPRGTR